MPFPYTEVVGGVVVTAQRQRQLEQLMSRFDRWSSDLVLLVSQHLPHLLLRLTHLYVEQPSLTPQPHLPLCLQLANAHKLPRERVAPWFAKNGFDIEWQVLERLI